MASEGSMQNRGRKGERDKRESRCRLKILTGKKEKKKHFLKLKSQLEGHNWEDTNPQTK